MPKPNQTLIIAEKRLFHSEFWKEHTNDEVLPIGASGQKALLSSSRAPWANNIYESGNVNLHSNVPDNGSAIWAFYHFVFYIHMIHIHMKIKRVCFLLVHYDTNVDSVTTV